MSLISRTKMALEIFIFTHQIRTRDDLAGLLKDIPLDLNLIPMEQTVDDTFGYDAKDPVPPLSIIPMKKILSLPWRAGEYQFEDIPPPPYDAWSTGSVRTIRSQGPDNPRWECERLAGFLRARNVAFDGSSTSVVVLARPNDPWKVEKDKADHAALVQIVGSLITAFARYVPQKIPLSASSKLTVSNVSEFGVHNNLDAGLAILSALPPLHLEGKGLFLIVDLSEVSIGEDGPSNNHNNLISTLTDLAKLNKAFVICVETTKTGSRCVIHEPGRADRNKSKSL